MTPIVGLHYVCVRWEKCRSTVLSSPRISPYLYFVILLITTLGRFKSPNYHCTARPFLRLPGGSPTSCNYYLVYLVVNNFFHNVSDRQHWHHQRASHSGGIDTRSVRAIWRRHQQPTTQHSPYSLSIPCQHPASQCCLCQSRHSHSVPRC